MPITSKPTPRVTGKPIPKMFSCGAARVKMPSATLVSSRAAMMGSEICRPERKISPPQAASCWKPPPLMGLDEMGRLTKLSASAASKTRWPLTVRNINVASMTRNWLMADDLPLVCGSKNEAKPRPMVRLLSSPASSMAENTMRMEKPMARPTSISCVRISKPGKDIGLTAGKAGTVGAMIMASSAPRVTLTVAGTAALPNRGAAAIRPRMRLSGHSSAAIQVFSSMLDRVSMAYAVAACLAHQVRDARKHLAHVVEHDGQHPRTGHDEGDKDADQLGDEGQGRLVDLRGRLENTHDQADDEGDEQHGRGHHQRDFHRMAAQGHDAFGCHRISPSKNSETRSPAAIASHRPARTASA